MSAEEALAKLRERVDGAFWHGLENEALALLVMAEAQLRQAKAIERVAAKLDLLTTAWIGYEGELIGALRTLEYGG